MSKRLVIISNRVAKIEEGHRLSTGGLAVAIMETLKHQQGLWFGWSGKISSSESVKIALAGPTTLATIDLKREDYDNYYNGFANTSLWPLLHYRPDLAVYNRHFLDAYRRVNALFAQRLLPHLQPEDLIWVHDYHLIPLASKLRSAGIASPIGFFLHTPFPTSEILVGLPQHDVIGYSLASYDLIGVQTPADLRSLREYLLCELGYHQDKENDFSYRRRRVRTGVFPISIDVKSFRALSAKSKDGLTMKRLRASLGQADLIIGVDRLDYSKGLPERIDAFRHFIETRPSIHRKVVFIQISPLSRRDIPEYQAIRCKVTEKAGNLNGCYAEIDWIPLRYLNKNHSRQELANLYRASRVGLVTPLRDGMNLVAKEYIAAQDPEDPGVLILSRFAGAAYELKEALIINPFDIEAAADALEKALSMTRDERQARWQALFERIQRFDIHRWHQDFLDALIETSYDRQDVANS